MQKDDLTHLSNLHKLCFPAKPWGTEEFANLKKSGCEIITSEHGFIVWRCVADECEIHSIGVHPDHRGAGIASAMIELMMRELKGINKIFLEVAVDNIAARGFYNKHGFVQVGVRPKYYDGKIDAIVMQKIIF